MSAEKPNYKYYWEKGVDYSTYLANFEKEVNEGSSKIHADMLPINWQRTKRLNKTVHIDLDSLSVIENIVFPRKWLVVTENWCGDSAQILPVIHKIAEASKSKIELRMVYRDENLNLIDAHLTNQGRSIPKLIQLNQNFEVTASWGPRPEVAQKLVKEIKSNPAIASTYSEELHKWYAKDQQVNIIRELVEMINQIE